MPETTVTAWADAASRVGQPIGATQGPDEVTGTAVVALIDSGGA